MPLNEAETTLSRPGQHRSRSEDYLVSTSRRY